MKTERPKFTARELAIARATKPTAMADFIFNEMTTFYMRKKCTVIVKNHKGTEIPYWSLFHSGYRNVEQIKRSGKYSITFKQITNERN